MIRRTTFILSLLFLMVWVQPSCTSEEFAVDSTLDNKEVGISANGLLASDRFDKLVVELLVVEGYEPKAESIDSLRSWLGRIVNKPGGIEVKRTVVTSPGLKFYTRNDIRVIESKYRTAISKGNIIAVSVFFSDEDFANDGSNQTVLGMAYANTSLVVFEKTIMAMTDEITEPDQGKLERTVIYHEFGHIFGLVNNGSVMQTQHQDEAHGKHCDNEDCLMNWVAETGAFTDKLLGTGKVPEFDNNCLADLRANGAK